MYVYMYVCVFILSLHCLEMKWSLRWRVIHKEGIKYVCIYVCMCIYGVSILLLCSLGDEVEFMIACDPQARYEICMYICMYMYLCCLYIDSVQP